MKAKLILREPKQKGVRDSGNNIFLEDIPMDCKVYIFYYPDIVRNNLLEEGLQNLGKQAGKNLFVNIGSKTDARFDKIVSAFEIERFPVIVITASADLASLQDQGEISTFYVKQYVPSDTNDQVSINKILQAVQEIWLLFIRGKVKDAIQHAKTFKRKQISSNIMQIIKGALGKISSISISVSPLGGGFELVLDKGSSENGKA
jgi:hypothetical protein